MQKNTKVSKESGEIADKFVFPSESRDYSDFKQMEMLLNKIAKGMQSEFPDEFETWLTIGQGKKDFADFVIHHLKAMDFLS